jgi:hypothetical protein
MTRTVPFAEATRPRTRPAGSATALLLLAVIWMQAGCGSQGRGSVDSAQEATSAEHVVRQPAHPCDVFTLADVSSMFGVAEGSVRAAPGEVQSSATCEYEWKKPDWEAIETRNEATLKEALMPGGGGMAAWKHEPTESRLFITFHGAEFDSEQQAVQALDALIAQLAEGVGDESFPVQTTFQPLDGIGARAAWSDTLRQVSAVSGTTLYHVRLRGGLEPRDDRPQAEAVARRIAAAL